MNKELVLSSLDETKQLAEKIASFLIQENNFPISIHLTGDLGTGKTTLVKEVGHFLAQKKDWLYLYVVIYTFLDLWML